MDFRLTIEYATLTKVMALERTSVSERRPYKHIRIAA